MNLIFISPNFPLYYWNFCKSLKDRGVTVLGIGDAPYDELMKDEDFQVELDDEQS